MTRRTKLAAGGTALILAGLVFAGLTARDDSGSRYVEPPSQAQIDVLRDDALLFAAENGEAKPFNGLVVATTRQSVVSLTTPGATVDTDQDVYAVTLQGSFTVRSAPLPPGADAPTGNVLFLVYDASTGRLLDWGLLLAEPDLSQLGTVHPLGM